MNEQSEYRPTKSLRDMTPAEKLAHWEQVDIIMAQTSAAIAADFKRRHLPLECCETDLMLWARQRKKCILFVRHEHRSLKGCMVSRAGDPAQQFFLPDSQSAPRPQTSGRFVLTVVTDFILGKMPVDFKGVSPALVGDEWTDDDRKEWDDLRSTCRRINRAIESAPRRKWRQPSNITSTISPSNAA